MQNPCEIHPNCAISLDEAERRLLFGQRVSIRSATGAMSDNASITGGSEFYLAEVIQCLLGFVLIANIKSD